MTGKEMVDAGIVLLSEVEIAALGSYASKDALASAWDKLASAERSARILAELLARCRLEGLNVKSTQLPVGYVTAEDVIVAVVNGSIPSWSCVKELKSATVVVGE